MNKSELVSAVAEKAEITKKSAEEAVNAVLEVISETLGQEENVTLIGFGTWKVVERASRTGRNPQTGEVMTIPASKAPVFKAGKALKELVKNS